MINIFKKNITLKLLYRGSRDGFKSQDFRDRCGNIGLTLTIIESKEKNEIFGGYTEDKWDKNPPYSSPEHGWGGFKNHNSFLFKLNMNKDFIIL